MLWGDFQNLQSWLEPAPTFLGVETGETLNTKGTHVGMKGGERPLLHFKDSV